MALLDIRNLNIDIRTPAGDLHVVDNVDLTVNEGEIIALVGASGSGKSLMLQAITYLRKENIIFRADRFKIYNEDLLQMPSRRRRRVIGKNFYLIMQDPRTCLDPTMKIKEQLYEVMPKEKWYRIDRKIRNFITNKRRTDAIATLHRTGIKEHRRILNSYPNELSDVECQKVMISMAISARPKLIIADEPISNLGISSRLQILKLLDKYNKNEHTSILIICNDLASIANFADYFAIFYGGKIVEFGSRSHILNHPIHPYTASLVKAMMIMEDPAKEFNEEEYRLARVPDFAQMPVGCPYGPSCKYANRKCNKAPKLTITKTFRYFCHNPLGKEALFEDDQD